MAVVLFAEHLPYVKSTNLVVQIEAGLDSNTRLQITDSGYAINLQHHGQEERIRLYTPVSEQHDTKLLPSPPATSRTSRLVGLSRSRRSTATSEQNKILWTASQLGQSSCFCCGGKSANGDECNGPLLDRQTVKSYKDLPSEGWAEMMDLWHCHKPEEDHDHDQVNGKGYSASSKLTARSGVGYVDTLTILVSQEDCTNITVSDTTGSVACSKCGSPLGEVDSLCSGIRLFKPLLKRIKSEVDNSEEHYQVSKWLSSYLLALIDTSGARKFQGRYNDFTIWIFSPLVYYSLSTYTGQPEPAVKIFYKRHLIQPRAEATKLNSQNISLDELTLPATLEAALVDELGQANSILPNDARRFQDWNVALLNRFLVE
ncbi:ubiquitin-conjugating enzyme E2-binding protein [Elsinoe ampelina]|uniref:Ubiquitin-conjugating enzyme E2-binding protein n=1 Tax=Elsinoe ampelina TaxID=302913 RepID=A0A6A6GLH5_9PEZI|nr:ubiquitin-conjugating enzyme E2-binding protein [Elsinoe ampelina]